MFRRLDRPPPHSARLYGALAMLPWALTSLWACSSSEALLSSDGDTMPATFLSALSENMAAAGVAPTLLQKVLEKGGAHEVEMVNPNIQENERVLAHRAAFLRQGYEKTAKKKRHVVSSIDSCRFFRWWLFKI